MSEEFQPIIFNSGSEPVKRKPWVLMFVPLNDTVDRSGIPDVDCERRTKPPTYTAKVALLPKEFNLPVAPEPQGRIFTSPMFPKKRFVETGEDRRAYAGEIILWLEAVHCCTENSMNAWPILRELGADE